MVQGGDGVLLVEILVVEVIVGIEVILVEKVLRAGHVAAFVRPVAPVPRAAVTVEVQAQYGPEMIDELVQDIPDARQGFRMLFSTAPFPGWQRRLTWVREELGGNWYRTDDPPRDGWFCPALFRYFERAPRELYVKAERLNR